MLDLIKTTKNKLKPYAPYFYRSLNHLDDTQYLRWQIAHAPRLARFKNLHAGESCFIIGNGPSLRKMDLTPLRHCHTFGLNKIYLLFDKYDLDLSYHVSVNQHVIKQSVQHFDALSCPSFLAYRHHPWARQANKKFDYVYTGGPLCFGRDIQNTISEGYTVTFVAMQIAYFMGFERVFLIGVDHSFAAKGAPGEEQHLQGPDVNHFHADYFKGQIWHLPDLEGSEVAYRLANLVYRQAGRQILDATLGGKLQVFPKICFEQALADGRGFDKNARI